jgi:transcriptional regulator of heat shock response
LKKKIVEYENKLKDVPKVERLESHLANKILEQEAIKKQLEKLRTDKEKETKMIQQKYEQDMQAMREEMQNKFQQILAKIDVADLK